MLKVGAVFVAMEAWLRDMHDGITGAETAGGTINCSCSDGKD